MAETVELTVQYYDVGEKSFKGGAKIHSIKTQDGSRYSAFVKSDQPLANPGDKVKTQVEENSKGYVNFDPEKFRVLERGKGHQQSGSSGNGSSYGVEVGHAINNAVLWLGHTCGGEPITIREIEEAAGQIFRLSHKMKQEASEGTLFEEPGPVTDFSHEMQSQASDDEDFNDEPPF